MNVRGDRRQAALVHMAAHLLREGLSGSSLRLMAAAAGTSDRMLLYYFKDKDDLLTATLIHIAGSLTALLDVAVPSGKAYEADILMRKLWDAMKSEAVRPFMHLWLELAAGAARSNEPHRTIAGSIATAFLNWIENRLDVEAGSGAAAALLARVEGILILDAIGHRCVAEAAVKSCGN